MEQLEIVTIGPVFIFSDVFHAVAVIIAKTPYWRDRQRQRHKLRIWLVERVKISVLHVRHALMNKSAPSSAKQQREIT